MAIKSKLNITRIKTISLFEMDNKLPDNQLLLPNGKLITFNDEQYDGINKIRTWLKSDKTFFTLSGYAGTGKSTCIKKILDEYHGGIVVSAPTHKAKKVIKNTTGKQAETLHALLGLRPDLDLDQFDPNRPQFNPIAIPRISDYNICVIDEASMINQSLYDLIKLTLSKIKNNRTKVLFMGDPAQIPPVGEKESVVFNQETNEFHQLTKVERQNDTNPLAFIYDALRNNLNVIDGGFERKTNVNNLGEGVIFTINKEEFRNKIIEKFKSNEFKTDSDFIKVIAWKNITVMQSNKIIRTALIGDNVDVIEKDDIIMGYRSITTNNNRRNIIENSADYNVIYKSNLEENKYNIKGFRVKLKESLGQGLFNYEDVFVVDSNDHDNLHKYAEKHDYYRDLGKSNKKLWPQYYEFRRNNLIMITINKHRNGTHRDNSDVIVKDLDYGYCITAHKAQGSTYSHVMVLETDMNDNWLVKERNQLKYVSLTRPSISATVLTSKIDE